VHAITLLVQQRLARDVAAFHDRVELRVLPPLCPLAVPAADFSHARELIAHARAASGQWLDQGNDRLPHPERFLSLHGHPHSAAGHLDRGDAA
jgi:NTE family protein